MKIKLGMSKKRLFTIGILLSIVTSVLCFGSSWITTLAGLSCRSGEVFAQSDVVIDEAVIDDMKPEAPEFLEGEVVEIIEQRKIEFFGTEQDYQKLRILITKGSFEGKKIIIENGSYQMAEVILYEIGDDLAISYSQGADGGDAFFITDYVRRSGLVRLFTLFVVVSLVVGSQKGFLSLSSMGISFLVIFSFILPQIQAGGNPVWISVLGSIVIIPITFYMSHGINKKTSVAIVGTFISLILTGILSQIFVNATYLTGTSSEEALFLQTMGNMSYDLRGLLQAGIIIGALGVLDDVTVSQSAVVFQLFKLDKKLSFMDLYGNAIQVGKDHIASMINTLVLVYTGASLPLLLLFLQTDRSFLEVLNLELIAVEVVKTLVGSIGLVLAVPITTFLAVYVALMWKKK